MSAPPSERQIKRLINASENLAAYFAIDACRVIAEASYNANLAPYLKNLPVTAVREFDEAICAITHPDLITTDEDAVARAKYDAAMAEMRKSA